MLAQRLGTHFTHPHQQEAQDILALAFRRGTELWMKWDTTEDLLNQGTFFWGKGRRFLLNSLSGP